MLDDGNKQTVDCFGMFHRDIDGARLQFYVTRSVDGERKTITCGASLLKVADLPENGPKDELKAARETLDSLIRFHGARRIRETIQTRRVKK